jgi:hypothetical protein
LRCESELGYSRIGSYQSLQDDNVNKNNSGSENESKKNNSGSEKGRRIKDAGARNGALTASNMKQNNSIPGNMYSATMNNPA